MFSHTQTSSRSGLNVSESSSVSSPLNMYPCAFSGPFGIQSCTFSIMTSPLLQLCSGFEPMQSEQSLCCGDRGEGLTPLSLLFSHSLVFSALFPACLSLLKTPLDHDRWRKLPRVQRAQAGGAAGSETRLSCSSLMEHQRQRSGAALQITLSSSNGLLHAREMSIKPSMARVQFLPLPLERSRSLSYLAPGSTPTTQSSLSASVGLTMTIFLAPFSPFMSPRGSYAIW